ncbi:MAG TPA: transporter [Planctomycetaceae bacterium]|nr:transporter [Planctomycetaceae bacterium]
MTLSLGLIDLVVLLVSIAAAVLIGLKLGGKSDSVEAFLVGNRSLPWWAILGSIVATETSTATVLSVPGTGASPTGMRFLQIAFGYIVGRVLVVRLLLPLFFEGKLFSAYEVLQRRFGAPAKVASSLLFLISRNLGDGLRLFLAAIVLQVLVGWHFAASACAIGVLTIVYTYLGGIRSVIWNDCIQFVVYMLGGVASVFVIVAALPNGWSTFADYAGLSPDSDRENKLKVFQFTPPAQNATTSDPKVQESADDGNIGSDESATTTAGESIPKASAPSTIVWLLTDAYAFWTALIGGAVLTLGTHGTDQMMVQRYLSARSQKDAALAIMLSSVVVMAQFALFLFIGVLLGCFYTYNPAPEDQWADKIYAHFIVNHFPQNTGLIGLMLAAILAAAMSTLSSSLNASASAVLNDFVLPIRDKKGKSLTASQKLNWTRWLSALFGCLQIAIGIVAVTFDDSVVINALSIAGFSAGLLLGLFLLGTLTRRVGTWHALAGAAAGLLVLLWVQFGPMPGDIRIAWPWFATIGASVTFAVGWLVSILDRSGRLSHPT